MPTDSDDLSRDVTIGSVNTLPRGDAAVVIAGRYKTLRLVARGGMASVFLAEQLALHRPVALKILNPPPPGEGEADGSFERRFKLEAETLATLVHPNIVTIFDYGQDGGSCFLAMEYVDGPRFTDLLVRGPLPVDRTIGLLLQVCSALRYAHKRGVVHRDLKPSNLLITRDEDGEEQVKVVDFGLVKVAERDQSLTREGVVMGSPHCMAPEQVQGIAVDHRADIYALGVLLFRCLTGTYPFHGSNATATMMLHLTAEVPAFSRVAPDVTVPPQVEAVVRKCLARRPDDRYPDIAALAADLGRCIGIAPQMDSQSLSLDEPLPGPSVSPVRSPTVPPTVHTFPPDADTATSDPLPPVAKRRDAGWLLLLGLLGFVVVGLVAVVVVGQGWLGGGDDPKDPPVVQASPAQPGTDPVGVPPGSGTEGTNGAASPSQEPGPNGTSAPPDAASEKPLPSGATSAPATSAPATNAPATGTTRPATTTRPKPKDPAPTPPPGDDTPAPPPGYMELPSDLK